MSDPRSTITIRDPDRFQATVEHLTRLNKADGFAAAYLRLLNLLATYLNNPLPTTARSAEVWADRYSSTDFYWCIWQHDADDRESRVLAGGLNCSKGDQSWSINT